MRTIYIVESQQDQERLKQAIPQLDHHPTITSMILQIPTSSKRFAKRHGGATGEVVQKQPQPPKKVVTPQVSSARGASMARNELVLSSGRDKLLQEKLLQKTRSQPTRSTPDKDKKVSKSIGQAAAVESIAQAAVNALMQRIKTLQQTLLMQTHYDIIGSTTNKPFLFAVNCVILFNKSPIQDETWTSWAASAISLVLNQVARQVQEGQAKVSLRFITDHQTALGPSLPGATAMCIPSFIVQSFFGK
jgi:hypothetical protein